MCRIHICLFLDFFFKKYSHVQTMVRPRGCAQFSHQELKREDWEGLKAGVVVIYKAAKRGEGAWRGASLTKPFTRDKENTKSILACVYKRFTIISLKRSLSCLPSFISKARRTWASIKTHLYFLFPFSFNPSFHVLCLPFSLNSLSPGNLNSCVLAFFLATACLIEVGACCIY